MSIAARELRFRMQSDVHIYIYIYICIYDVLGAASVARQQRRRLRINPPVRERERERKRESAVGGRVVGGGCGELGRHLPCRLLRGGVRFRIKGLGLAHTISASLHLFVVTLLAAVSYNVAQPTAVERILHI